MPARNEPDLENLPADVRSELKIHLIKRVDEILALVLEPPAPAPPSPIEELDVAG
jgi:ATP-dependent Lon protease